MTGVTWHYPVSLVEHALLKILPRPGGSWGRLHDAMRYAVLGGGKRLRSQLVLEAAHVVGGRSLEVALPAACAIELIHAYSLVHDDLPAMDDAMTRRGRPSCHAAFGQATAILAGDGLLTLAFEAMAGADGSAAAHTRMLRATGIIARAAGAMGMVGGQAIDMAWSEAGQSSVGEQDLVDMHALKTGALIQAAAEVGGVLGGGSNDQVQAMASYGAHLGRAFQIRDDLLDVLGNPRETGKGSSDTSNGKITAPAIFGLDKAKALATEASEAALSSLQSFGDEAEALRGLARYAVEREK